MGVLGNDHQGVHPVRNHAIVVPNAKSGEFTGPISEAIGALLALSQAARSKVPQKPPPSIFSARLISSIISKANLPVGRKNAGLGLVLISNVPENSPRRWVFGNSKPKGRGGKGKGKEEQGGGGGGK